MVTPDMVMELADLLGFPREKVYEAVASGAVSLGKLTMRQLEKHPEAREQMRLAIERPTDTSSQAVRSSAEVTERAYRKSKRWTRDK